MSSDPRPSEAVGSEVGPPRAGSEEAAVLARFAEYRRTGAVEVRNQLVEDHLNLARGFARRYSRRGVPVDDLEQVARLGLIAAVERFDPGVGVKFATYAGRTIEGELKRYFRDKAWSVRVPRRYQDLGLAVREAMDRLSTELGRTPTIPELASAVGAEIDEVLASMEAAQAFQAASIDAPPPGSDRSGPAASSALRTDDAGPALVDDRDAVAGLLQRLPERERRIVELRFFAEKSQRQIADEVGVSQMHVSRLLRKALATLHTLATGAGEAMS